jgi:hypothetical protein
MQPNGKAESTCVMTWTPTLEAQAHATAVATGDAKNAVDPSLAAQRRSSLCNRVRFIAPAFHHGADRSGASRQHPMPDPDRRSPAMRTDTLSRSRVFQRHQTIAVVVLQTADHSGHAAQRCLRADATGFAQGNMKSVVAAVVERAQARHCNARHSAHRRMHVSGTRRFLQFVLLSGGLEPLPTKLQCSARCDHRS